MYQEGESGADALREDARVVDAEGVEGRVVSVDGRVALICSPEGLHVSVPLELFSRDSAGSWRVPFGFGGLRIPVIEEQPVVKRRVVDTGGVRVEKSVHTRTEHLEPVLSHEELEVERVPIDALVEDTRRATMRREGETWIFPVLEEVLVVSKQLRLVEEVRVTRRRKVERAHQEVELLREEIDVKRI